nr:hypothetical protein [uncultured Albidiferax sp.]
MAGLNAEFGNIDEHQSEGIVQGRLANMLKVELPSKELVRQNKKLLENAVLGSCIPDILIDSVDGRLWATIELKTLFHEDRLDSIAVQRDIDKLCAYKKSHPDAAAYFLLIGHRVKLHNGRKSTPAASIKINYTKPAFANSPPSPQAINKDFFALPCGSHDVEGFVVSAFLWEIFPTGWSGGLTPSYSFSARMS